MAEPAGQGDAPSGGVGHDEPVFVLLAVMLLLTFNPGLRSHGGFSGSGYRATIPFHQYFVPTVFIIGSSIMIVIL